MVKKFKVMICCIVIAWLHFPNFNLWAEEVTEDDSTTIMIAESSEEFLENLVISEESEDEIALFSSELYKGERIGKHYHNGQFISYITKMYIEGQLAYCLEPYVLIPGGQGSTIPGYEASGILSYDRLDYATKVKIWKIAYYGYGYNGKWDNERFAATQCLIWDAINEPQEAYTMSDEPWDLSAVKNEINYLVETNPAGQVPSFAGDTVKLSLNKSVNLKDENYVLANYAIPEVKNIAINQNGNELNLKLENSMDFASSLNASGSVYNALVQSVIWKNADYQIMFTQHYEPMKDFSLFFELDAVPFSLLKLDKETRGVSQGEATLIGAVISIREAQSKNEILQLTMNDSNSITYEDLPAGEYLACEIVAPQGYLLNNQCVPFSTLSNHSVQVEIKDEVIRGQIEIIKKDTESGLSPINEAEFTVFDTKGQLVDTIKVVNGKGISTSLPYGHYTIKESVAPQGYVLSEEEFEVFIDGRKEVISVEILNQPQKGQITIMKQDEETGNEAQGEASLHDVVYEIFAEKEIVGYDGQVLYQKNDLVETVKAEGTIAKSSSVPIGTYRVCEKIASVGYNLNPACEIVELSLPDKTELLSHSEINFKNSVIKGKVAITKFIIGDENLKENRNSGVVSAGKGFSFDVIALKNNEVVDTLITDENGVATSNWLPYGRYLIKEKDKIGFEIAKEFEIMISENEKTVHFILENDVFESELIIYKVDKETNKRVLTSGASFKIKDSNGNFITQTVTYPQKVEIDTFTTDSTGSIHLPSPLSFGTYTLVEVHAPVGYVLSDEEIEFQVDGTSKEIVIEFPDKPTKGILVIEKTGEVLSGFDKMDTPFGTVAVPKFEEKILDGVTYRIIAREDIVTSDQTVWYRANETVTEFTTSKDEPTTSIELPLGAYSFYEVQSKAGYIKDEKIYDFDLVYENECVEIVTSYKKHFNKRKKAILNYEKSFEDSVFGENEEMKEGVVFGLYNAKDILMGDEVVLPQGSLLGYSLLKKDFSGSFDIELAGNYFIKEIASGNGYELNEKEYYFTVDFSDMNQDIFYLQLDEKILNETKKGSLTIIKRDEFYETGEELLVKDGFVFEISTDEKFNNIISQQETDENGKVVFDNLEIGTYYVRESDCPHSYLLSDEVFEVQIMYRENTEIEVVNKRRLVELEIIKRDYDDESKLLEDAEFRIKEVRSGNEVFTGKTNQDGKLRVSNLKWGEDYEICETKTPKGYTYLTENGCKIWNGRLNEDLSILTEEWINKREKGNLHITKTDEYGKVFSGSVFEISSHEDFDEILYTIDTDENGEIYIEQIPTGVYYLREIDCDERFELNTSIVEVEISANQTQEIVFENRYRDIDVKIIKTDEKDNLLNEAEFIALDITDGQVLETYYLTLGETIDLAEFFLKDVRYISSEESVISIEGTWAKAQKEGDTLISAVDKEGQLKKVVLIKCISSIKDQKVFWQEENLKGDVTSLDWEDQILFKGRTGHSYLHITDLQHHNAPLREKQVAFYNSYDSKNPVVIKISDEFGMICLDEFDEKTWYYEVSGSDARLKIEVNKSDGELMVQGLKWGREYLLIETALPQGMMYDKSPFTKIDLTLGPNETIYDVTIRNKTRKVSLKVTKTDDKQEKKLNGASFILKDKDSNLELEEKITGTLFIKDTDESSFLARDKEMNEMISILHPNQFNEILENLPEGTYYLQTISEMMSDVQQVKIEKGVAVFHNLNAGKEYILYENEAPSGYLKQEEEISIVLNPDFLTDEVEVVLTNSLIEIPNMKEQ